MADDFYSVLGVKRDASAEEIRKAYRKLSRENHPDVKPDDATSAARFKQVQEAYSVLGDAEKRAKYDRFGPGFNRTGGGHPYQWSGGQGQSGPVDMGDLFGEGFDLGDLFGGFGGRTGASRRGRARPAKGQDLRAEANVPFLIAALGGEVELTLDRGGSSERISVKIPAGISGGSTVRLSGQGFAGAAGGPAGDLLLNIKVLPHPYFRREGNDLTVDIPVTPAEAALGARVEVPTLNEGVVTLTLPPGSSSGRKLRLRGKGIADRKGAGRGDQYVQLKIVIPEPLSETQKQLYEQLRQQDLDPRAGMWMS